MERSAVDVADHEEDRPRIEIRSGSSVPGNIAGITLTLENDAVRIFRRYGSLLPSPTR
jgi:hypothetical protein